MIKCGDGEVHFEGSVGQILGETTEILRGVRRYLEKETTKEEADEWIDKIVRRSAMTRKEEVIDTLKEARKLHKEQGTGGKDPFLDFVEMFFDTLLDADEDDSEEN